MLNFKKVLIIPIMIVFICLFNSANAGIIFTDKTYIIEPSQNDIKLFSISGYEDYTNLLFTFQARGDYGDTLDENISFLIDDVYIGTYDWTTFGSAVGPTNKVNGDWILNFSFTISDVDWANYASNSYIKVEWDNSDKVGAFSLPSYVEYTLTGQPITVPAPAPFIPLILGLCLTCLRVRIFK
jgi:hypothetical protein